MAHPLPDVNWTVSHRGQVFSALSDFGGLPLKETEVRFFSQIAQQEAEVKVCPVCGTSATEFHRTRMLGCSACYDVFTDDLAFESSLPPSAQKS